jgi:hypothetical protein
MDKIIEVSEDDGDAIVQTGVKWEDLNKHLADKGVPLFFPLDPGPGATIGGMAGTGCSGTNAVRYGTAKAEWFLNLVRCRPSFIHHLCSGPQASPSPRWLGCAVELDSMTDKSSQRSDVDRTDTRLSFYRLARSSRLVAERGNHPLVGIPPNCSSGPKGHSV